MGIRRQTLWSRLTALLWFSSLMGACDSAPDPGSIELVVHATPAPDDVALSPLTDGRAQEVQLWDLHTGELLGRSLFQAAESGTAISSSLSLGSLLPWEHHSLYMELLGSGGQQLLGLALARDTSWQFGQKVQIPFELRRPLFFFGGEPKLVAPYMPTDGGNPAPYFAPNRQLSAALRDETKLRVVDPNAVEPLLSQYDRQLLVGGTSALPITASAGTFDGQTLLAVSGNQLHVIDTLKLEEQSTLTIPDNLPVYSIIISSDDRRAALLLYKKPPATSGRVGSIIIFRDLDQLRSRLGDGQPISIDIDASLVSPIGVPLSATFAPDGLLDVLIALPPVQLRQPDCSGLGGSNKSLLQRYAPESGEIKERISLSYTTAISYTAAGERLLVQPCTKAPAANRLGQVLVMQKDSDLVFPAPGTAEVATAGRFYIAVGSEDVQSGTGTNMRAAVRILDPEKKVFSRSFIDMPAWEVPYQITLGTPDSVNLSFAPREILAYGTVVSQDLTRALVLMRVNHGTYPGGAGLFLYSDSPNNRNCWIQWQGYTYHVLIINLQSGAKERDYMVGVQNQSCSATFRSNSTGSDSGISCFNPCKSTDSNPFLIGYQDGYIPTAASVLFGRY